MAYFHDCLRQRLTLILPVTRARYSIAMRCIATCTNIDVKFFFRLNLNKAPLKKHGN